MPRALDIAPPRSVVAVVDCGGSRQRIHVTHGRLHRGQLSEHV